jgi:hypothetical protein
MDVTRGIDDEGKRYGLDLVFFSLGPCVCVGANTEL